MTTQWWHDTPKILSKNPKREGKKNQTLKFITMLRIDVEEMIFSVEPTTYENTETGIELARTDFRNRKLTSKFLSMSEILN